MQPEQDRDILTHCELDEALKRSFCFVDPGCKEKEIEIKKKSKAIAL